MYAMRRGGAQLMTIFYALSENANIYGEVALEVRQIVRDVDFFGSDVVTAIRQLQKQRHRQNLRIFSKTCCQLSRAGAT